ncbi:hypothetical protein ACF0H5_003044 [Mactra antiquata]
MRCFTRRSMDHKVLTGSVLLLLLIWIIYFYTDLLSKANYHVNKQYDTDEQGRSLMTSNDDVVKDLYEKSTMVMNGTKIYIDRNALPKDNRLFQSAEEQEFPTTADDTYRIPHIIHQIYTDENIPRIFIPLIQTFTYFNPKWKYMLWTYASGRTLIKKTHPYLIDAYDTLNRQNGVKRTDVLRMVILYEFGGLYADMDVINLRSLDIATKKYACIIPVEPFEHAATYKKSYFMSNAVMLCRPKHPFFKMVLMGLLKVDDEADPVAVTGPAFLTRMFQKYNKITPYLLHAQKKDMSSNSPSFYKGEYLETDDNALYVPNSQYFMDNISPEIHKRMMKSCDDVEDHPSSQLTIRACSELVSRMNVRLNRKYTFTVHYWYNLYLYPPRWLRMLTKVPIREIVPYTIMYQLRD